MAARTRATRALALLLVGFAFVGPLASVAHLALVEHVACEHGELVHVARRLAPRAPSVAASRATPAIAGASAADSHGHDHCLVAPTRRTGFFVHARRALAVCLARARLAHRRAAILAPPIAILILAPKHSPPAA